MTFYVQTAIITLNRERVVFIVDLLQFEIDIMASRVRCLYSPELQEDVCRRETVASSVHLRFEV